VLYFIASGRADFSVAGGFHLQRLRHALAGRLFDEVGLVCQVVMTFMFDRFSARLTNARPVDLQASRSAWDSLIMISIRDEYVGQSGAQHRNRLFVGDWPFSSCGCSGAPVVGAAIAGLA
jgi:aquaporin Z